MFQFFDDFHVYQEFEDESYPTYEVETDDDVTDPDVIGGPVMITFNPNPDGEAFVKAEYDNNGSVLRFKISEVEPTGLYRVSAFLFLTANVFPA